MGDGWFSGPVMELVTSNRGEFKRMEYLQHSIIQDDGSKKGEGRPVRTGGRKGKDG